MPKKAFVFTAEDFQDMRINVLKMFDSLASNEPGSHTNGKVKTYLMGELLRKEIYGTSNIITPQQNAAFHDSKKYASAFAKASAEAERHSRLAAACIDSTAIRNGDFSFTQNKAENAKSAKAAKKSSSLAHKYMRSILAIIKY